MCVCCQCGRELTRDEIGLSKKLINRGMTKFFCLFCLADVFSVDPLLLEIKIEQFRAMGCTLFL